MTYSHVLRGTRNLNSVNHAVCFRLICISMNMSSLVVALGAWAFSSYEGWSYIDSIYYCVITLTTVGFGDFVALQRPQQRQLDYIAFSIFFILAGLAVVSAAMNLLILRFLTMNTVDERRDESLAAIRRSLVKLDAGDRLVSVNGSVITPPLRPRSSDVPVDLAQSLPFSSFFDDDTLETRSSPTRSVARRQPSTFCRQPSTFSSLCCFRCRRRNGVDVRRDGWPSTSPGPRRQRYRVTRPPTAVVTHLLSPVPCRQPGAAVDHDVQPTPAVVHARPDPDTSTTLWIETSNFHEPDQSLVGFVGSSRRTSSF